ncbi:MAG: hypothetical protein HY875_08605 [Chloroflexi bacterium]|nr:hypothetical protein [Chloroflexota bacterium]
MTELMQRALSALRELPEEQQDWIAAVILEELESERRWDELLAASPELLERWATEAEASLARGEGRPL